MEIAEHSRYQFSWFLVEKGWEEAQWEVEKKKKEKTTTTKNNNNKKQQKRKAKGKNIKMGW